MNEHQSSGVVEVDIIRTRNLALEQSYSKELEVGHVVFP